MENVIKDDDDVCRKSENLVLHRSPPPVNSLIGPSLARCGSPHALPLTCYDEAWRAYMLLCSPLNGRMFSPIDQACTAQDEAIYYDSAGCNSRDGWLPVTTGCQWTFQRTHH